MFLFCFVFNYDFYQELRIISNWGCWLSLMFKAVWTSSLSPYQSQCPFSPSPPTVSPEKNSESSFQWESQKWSFPFSFGQPAVSSLKISFWDFHFMTNLTNIFLASKRLWEYICHYKKVKARNAFCHAGQC